MSTRVGGPSKTYNTVKRKRHGQGCMARHHARMALRRIKSITPTADPLVFEVVMDCNCLVTMTFNRPPVQRPSAESACV